LKVAVVIPAYNEAQTIASVIAGVRGHGLVIVVDDCSSDGTGDIAAKSGATVVQHAANRGYDGALQSGFEKAMELGIDAVVTFDADGQHDPAVLDQFIAPLAQGEVDLVIGIRPGTARIAEALFGLYTRLRFGVNDILCGLKAYRMTLYNAHGRFDGTRSIGTELALAGLAGGARWTTVAVPIHDRVDAPRFGSTLRANRRIFRAMLIGIGAGMFDKSSGYKQ